MQRRVATSTAPRRDIRSRQRNFNLVPLAALPPKSARQGIYVTVLAEFLADDEPQEIVEFSPPVKPTTATQGLRKAIKQMGLDHVRVMQRGGDVILVSGT